MKKVVFLINSLASGGAEKVMTVIISKLIKDGFDVELICLESNIFYELPKGAKLTFLNHTANKSGLRKLFELPYLAFKLKNYIDKNNINLIQSHVYRANYVNLLAKLFGSNHIAQIVNVGAISRYFEEGLSGKVNLFLIKNLYKRADLIISKAEGMQNDMQKLFNFRNSKTIINNPYDISLINNLKHESIEEFKFNKEKKYLISIGRFETFKRQDYIIKALSKLDDNVELILIGDGPNKKNLELLAKNLNIYERVHFLGRVKNPYKFIFRSDIFILSSDDGEGFPNVLVESMICGTVVISSDCISGPREILAPNTNIKYQEKEKFEIAEYGILYPKSNILEMVKAIDFLFNDEKLMKTFIEKAQKRSNDFSVNQIVEQYKNVLRISK
ncbi:glycosyl transferase [Arcobacter sp. CECT 8983]|uniref:glycosyltransferase n=1 Tax=Arcobacter sp. CECT 8983 TaxID=2044508 RepID=UPI00100C1785|nr:glycosyltransferase [Arcobacter sp. CECT 8983]RXJ90612.1 glycosyl transferase [Arcobacter sp. CECT 8983]